MSSMRLTRSLKAAAPFGLVGVHLAAVLYARARRDRAPARRGTRRAHQCSLFLGRTFPWRDPDREGSSARMRHHPAQNPQTAAAGNEDREPGRVLSAPGGGIAQLGVSLGTAFPQIPPPALKRVKADEGARTYTDLALSASSDEELNEMDLIQVFKGAIARTHGAPGVAPEPALL